MSLDYDSPRYPLRLGAQAAGFEVNTLRSLYQRGHFQIIGGEEAKARGLSAFLNLRDILCIAVAKRLIDAGAHPKAAFEAGKHFAHFSNGGSLGTAHEFRQGRNPSEVYADGFTVMIFFPSTGFSKVVPMSDTLDFCTLFIDPSHNGRHNPILVLLNDVERAVFAGLRLNFRPDQGWTNE